MSDAFTTTLASSIEPEPTWWATVESDLRAPFPWFGGKSRVASLVWDRFGEVVNYVEPFAGSLAVLFSRPHAPKIETVNDLDGHLANFWRSIQHNPQAVADAADYPVNELEIHARHRYLSRKVKRILAARLLEDPLYHNATIAGWWVWGLCAWIGSGWCQGEEHKKMPRDGGRGAVGVHAQGMRLPMLGAGSGWDGEPQAHHGKGVHGLAMRGGQLPKLTSNDGIHAASMRVSGQLPDLGARAEGIVGGRSVHGGSMRAPGQLPYLGGSAIVGQGTHSLTARSRLYEVFAALANRLRYVRVTCGDFERILSDAVTWRHGTTGVFLDPPYPADAGSTGGLYTSTSEERAVFDRAFAYCLKNGHDKRLRIALCYYDGTKVGTDDVSKKLESEGWSVVAWKAGGGYAGQGTKGGMNATRERVAFSPGCLSAQQLALFG